MNVTLLKKYIRTLLEAEDPQARTPNQLINPDEVGNKHKDENKDEADTGASIRKKFTSSTTLKKSDAGKMKEVEINEFSGVGAIAGYAAPLGAKGGRNKEPGWK